MGCFAPLRLPLPADIACRLPLPADNKQGYAAMCTSVLPHSLKSRLSTAYSRLQRSLLSRGSVFVALKAPQKHYLSKQRLACVRSKQKKTFERLCKYPYISLHI